MTRRASASRPLRTRYSGDSGTPRRAQNSNSAGRIINTSIQRQFPETGARSVADAPASVVPTGHQPSIADSTRPRCRRGENSLTIA